MKKLLLKSSIYALSIFSVPMFAQTKYHVNINNGSDSNDGLKWSTAFKNLQTAIDKVKAGDTIFVAAGEYKPTKKYAEQYKDGTATTDRNRSFVISDSVVTMGGFPENATDATDLTSRNWKTNQTIITGDFNEDDDEEFNNMDENAYHVIIFFNATPVTVLDGFYIYGGNSNEPANVYYNDDIKYQVTYGCGGAIYSFSYTKAASPTLNNLIIEGNSVSYEGGGLFNYSPNDDASPKMTNVQFINNRAVSSTSDGGRGGAIYIEGKTTTASLTSITVTGNSATSTGSAYGGGMYFKAVNDCKPTIQNTLIAGNLSNGGGGLFFNSWTGTTAPTLTNVTISGNRATANNNSNGTNDGGGVTVFAETGASSPVIQNTVISDNAGGNKNEILIMSGGGVTNPTYSYSFVKGESLGGTNVDGNTDPMFANPASNDLAPTGIDYYNYQLRLGSPLINKGNNSYLTLTEDLEGQTRIYNSTIDIGAYESQGSIPQFNESLSSEKSIWSYQKKLYVRTGETATLSIYTLSGSMFKQVTLGEGTYEFAIPQGCYIVKLGNKTEKIVVR